MRTSPIWSHKGIEDLEFTVPVRTGTFGHLSLEDGLPLGVDLVALATLGSAGFCLLPGVYLRHQIRPEMVREALGDDDVLQVFAVPIRREEMVPLVRKFTVARTQRFQTGES